MSMRPTVKQLEYLLAVAETLHFRKAAELTSISQPALSAQIASLEELLDVQLFERTRRQVLLTPAGRQAVARAKQALEAIDAFTEAARSAKEPLCGPLRLGLIPTIAPYLLPRVLPGLRREFPQLQLFLREEFTHVLVDRLMSGEIDVALLALPVSGGDFASQSLFFDDFHVALPKGHALAARKEIAEEDLNHQEVLLLEDGHCLRDQALAICGRAGAAETARFRATSLGTLTQMVAGGMGLTLVPELALGVETGHTAELEVRPFKHPAPHREVGLIWRRASARREEFQLLGETLVRLLDA
jgi:LysR family hydrogen peroxide-inducible transcriptional activator